MASDLVSNESMWYGANLFSFKIRTSFLLLNEFTSGEIVDRMLGIWIGSRRGFEWILIVYIRLEKDHLLLRSN